VLASWQLTLDDAGQPRRVDVARAGLTAGNQTYTYDAAGRLLTGCTPSVTTAAGCPSGSTITYTYDAVGNRATSTTGGATTTYTYDAADQLKTATTGTATTTYTYDADGNQTGDGTRTFTYDAGNHLTGINSTTTNVFVNDADGNRVTVNQNGALFRTQLWDINGDGGLPQLATYTGATGNLYGDYQTAPDGTPLTLQTGTADFYLHHDWLGSITDVTDSAGVNQWRNGYDPFGVRVQSKLVTSAPTEPFGFTGAWADPYVANRTYLRARELDGPTGRFTQPDPVELRPGTPFEPDYTYAGNAPTHLTDPTGLCSAGALLKSIGGMFKGRFTATACQQEDAALAANGSRLTLGSRSLASQGDDAALAFGRGVGQVGQGMWNGFWAPWTVFTTDSDSTCYRVGAGIGGAFGAAYLVRDILSLTPGRIAGPGAGRHVGGSGSVADGRGLVLGRGDSYGSYVHGDQGLLAELGKDGMLDLVIQSGENTPRGGAMFNDAIEAFGSNVQGVRGTWKGGGALADNYNSFMAAVRSGLSPEAAAARTFTGKMSIKNGFRKIKVVSVTPEKVVVEFTR
jgi:RHS repeat-associated protein